MLPLEGTRVLDFTRHLPGPYATDLLRRLGADVIKIEPPDGDPTRFLPPFHGDWGALFVLVNAGKKSVVVDLKTDEGRAFVYRVAETCDVVVESYAPGVAAEFGIDAATLRAKNPRIVYCSISGYGAENPRSGHDANFVALAGLLDLQRDSNGRPVLPATQIGDMGGALFASNAILAALVEREKTGEGRTIDISMSDATRAMMPTAEALYRGTQHTPQSFFLTGAIPCYTIYRTADRKYLMVAALEPRFWEAFCRAIGHPDLVSLQYDEKARSKVFATIEAAIAAHPREHWEKVFARVDCCVEPVLTIEEAHERFGDPMARHPFATNYQAPAAAVDSIGHSLTEVARAAGLDDDAIRKASESPAFRPRHSLQKTIATAVNRFRNRS